MKLWQWFKGTKNPWVWRRTLQRPNEPPYMLRYQLLVTRWLVIYLNRILTPDPDPRFHTHPWPRSWSFKLWNSYWERLPINDWHKATGEKTLGWDDVDGFIAVHKPARWSRIPRRHRIVELLGGVVTTLFIGIGTPREWGFENDDGSVTPGPSSDGRKL